MGEDPFEGIPKHSQTREPSDPESEKLAAATGSEWALVMTRTTREIRDVVHAMEAIPPVLEQLAEDRRRMETRIDAMVKANTEMLATLKAAQEAFQQAEARALKLATEKAWVRLIQWAGYRFVALWDRSPWATCLLVVLVTLGLVMLGLDLSGVSQRLSGG